jgi:circadian clock protein KaiB
MRLRLYVSEGSMSSFSAIENVERLREILSDVEFELEIVDVRAHPEVTERDRILATPTLLKLSPEPNRRIVGDLGDVELVARYLTSGSGSGSGSGGVL